jgi:hypothetical protein
METNETMSNNKQSSVEWLYFAMEGFIHKSARVHFAGYLEQAKQMHNEEMQTQYQDGREAVILESIATLSTIKANSYSDGFNDGYMKALSK